MSAPKHHSNTANRAHCGATVRFTTVHEESITYKYKVVIMTKKLWTTQSRIPRGCTSILGTLLPFIPPITGAILRLFRLPFYPPLHCNHSWQWSEDDGDKVMRGIATNNTKKGLYLMCINSSHVLTAGSWQWLRGTTPQWNSQGGRLLASFSAFTLSLTTRVYRYYENEWRHGKDPPYCNAPWTWSHQWRSS